ncbi:MAG TPA: hypothetical protein VK604_13250, partial [Bryobacteraceae bacterium]|nr:hypothetical protein [Bryobacteraceae bacterium]
MLADQYLIAASLYFFSIAYLAAKIVSWDEARRHIAGTRRAISILVLVAATGIFAASCKWINVRKQNVASQPAPPSPFQVEETMAIERFFSEDESELRQAFGFPAMLEINVAMATDKIRYLQQHGGTAFDLTPYLRGGAQMLFDSSIASDSLHRQGGGFVLKPDPTKVQLIVLPARYSEGEKTLSNFEKSVGLPTNVTAAVGSFNSAVQGNANALLKALNKALQMDKRYYLLYGDSKSPYFHAIDQIYFDSCVQLQPKAAAVLRAVRKNTKP